MQSQAAGGAGVWRAVPEGAEDRRRLHPAPPRPKPSAPPGAEPARRLPRPSSSRERAVPAVHHGGAGRGPDRLPPSGSAGTRVAAPPPRPRGSGASGATRPPRAPRRFQRPGAPGPATRRCPLVVGRPGYRAPRSAETKSREHDLRLAPEAPRGREGCGEARSPWTLPRGSPGPSGGLRGPAWGPRASAAPGRRAATAPSSPARAAAQVASGSGPGRVPRSRRSPAGRRPPTAPAPPRAPRGPPAPGESRAYLGHLAAAAAPGATGACPRPGPTPRPPRLGGRRRIQASAVGAAAAKWAAPRAPRPRGAVAAPVRRAPRVPARPPPGAPGGAPPPRPPPHPPPGRRVARGRGRRRAARGSAARCGGPRTTKSAQLVRGRAPADREPSPAAGAEVSAPAGLEGTCRRRHRRVRVCLSREGRNALKFPGSGLRG